MTEFAVNVQSLVEELMKFYEQIALLLNASDTIFADRGWTSTGKKATWVSDRLDQPTGWLSRYQFCFYRPNDERLRNRLAFVSVIIAESAHPDRITMPLLTAGCFEYDDPDDTGFEYWYAQNYLWMENATHDGRLAYAEKSIVKWKVPWNRVVMLAAPLETMTTAEMLRTTLEPLLTVIASDAPFSAASSR